MNRTFTTQPPSRSGYYWTRKEGGSVALAYIREPLAPGEVHEANASSRLRAYVFPYFVELILAELKGYEWAGPVELTELMPPGER